MRNLRGVDLATAATAEKQNTKRCCHWIARAGLECCPGWEAAGPGVPFLEPRRAVGNRSSGPNSLRLEEAQNRALMCRFREHYLLGLRVGLCLQNLTSVSHTCYYLNSTSCDGLWGWTATELPGVWDSPAWGDTLHFLAWTSVMPPGRAQEAAQNTYPEQNAPLGSTVFSTNFRVPGNILDYGIILYSSVVGTRNLLYPDFLPYRAEAGRLCGSLVRLCWHPRTEQVTSPSAWLLRCCFLRELYLCFPELFFFFTYFATGSHSVVHVGLAFNSQSSCLDLLSAGLQACATTPDSLPMKKL